MASTQLDGEMMEASHLIDSLNDPQREAVAAPPGSSLVLAGAGSGKTRVLVHRIAWLIETQGYSPYSILAVTFTNKAAAEMRGRIEQLLKIPVRGLWVGTFHGLAHRLLRRHWQDANLPQTFQIIDTDDQLRLVKRVMADLNIDEKQWPARKAVWWINSQKDEGKRPDNLEHFDDIFLKTHIPIYKDYQAACERGGLVDFAELLLRAHELWLNHPELLSHYQDRFSALLVDEFQDTNTLQYAWVRLLAGNKNNLMVVGDDDQSIYGWRGARIENIQRFTKDFPEASTIRLEQNYRSTSNILNAANKLIDKNHGRLGKQLWTDRGDGDLVHVYGAYNEFDEARFIVERIKRWVNEGNLHAEAAVLYRSNAQSRVLEEALLRVQMPYRIYGGQRFFERMEVRNVLAYMRLVASRDSDAAFERVVNTPTRGIGERSLEEIRLLARTEGKSLWGAARIIVKEGRLPGRASNAIATFIKLIDGMAANTANMSLAKLVEIVVEQSGLREYHAKEGGERGQARLENMDELVNAARGFDPAATDFTFATANNADQDQPLTLLEEFLAHAALEAGEGQAGANQDCVQMMTMHSAKGLEFPLVFLAGMEDGLFPHAMSVEQEGRLEEERRLCYVGMTRAMQLLYLTWAESRRMHGSEQYRRPSMFLDEIPNEVIQEVRASGSITRPGYAARQYADDSQPSHPASGSFNQPGFNPKSQRPWSTTEQALPAIKPKTSSGAAIEKGIGGTDLSLGQRVKHAKFGEGVVLNYEGSGTNARVHINFDIAGSKWLVMGYANLEPVA